MTTSGPGEASATARTTGGRALRLRGAVCALSIVLLGMTIPTPGFLAHVSSTPWGSWLTVNAWALMLYVVTIAAALVPLGRGALRAALGGRPHEVYLAIAVAAAVAEYWAAGHVATPHQLMRGAEVSHLVWLAVIDLVLVAPLLEELVFRGVLWEASRRLMPAWCAILLTATAFTMLHASEKVGFLFFAGACIAGWLRHRSGSLSPCVLGHSVYNLLVVWNP